ncbi:MAG: hypothetical protein KJZ87_12545 [Thermoguttaceae bacterium]|nr:hypothetical protein [Thermoguttaceae bacterium]
MRLAVPEAHLCQFAVSGPSPFGREKWRTPAERFPRTNRRPSRTLAGPAAVAMFERLVCQPLCSM